MSEEKEESQKSNTPAEGRGFPKNQYNEHCWIIGEPKIGPNVWIGAFTLIDGSGGLEIGTGVDISSGAQILTHSSHKRCISARKFYKVERKNVKIGDYSFIGANATVMMGVNIGKHCIIGAGAVVSKDVPDYSVVAGVPAKIIGKVIINESGDVEIEILKKTGGNK